MTDLDGPKLSAAAAVRTAAVIEALRRLDEQGLRAPSRLEGWSRLTLACHLRYGADAHARMTRDALAGVPTSYFPAGRVEQRPGTLEPEAGETAAGVVESLAAGSINLQRAWASVNDVDWNRDVVEPEDNPDLGPLTLVQLPLVRLTEVEVHASDLKLGLDTWSDLFVEVALPFRLEWLNVRRTNHRDVDGHVQGSWLLVASDGPTYLVSVEGSEVRSRPATSATSASAVIEGSSRDLLALLLDRPTVDRLQVSGDVAFARAFERAFPGP